MGKLTNYLRRLKKGTEEENYGRHILEKWGSDFLLKQANVEKFTALDIGCGWGNDLVNIRNRYAAGNPEGPPLEMHGIEDHPIHVDYARQNGIVIHKLDVEREELPLGESSADIVIANQILEHTKEIFWIFEEASRVLRPGGIFIIGVPNLASLHNRILLLLGEQPAAQRSFSAHVRAFTKPDLKFFAETGGYFRLLDFRGANFYPFGARISRFLAGVFPTLAWGIFFLLERTTKEGHFLECLETESNFLETPFYGSPHNPAKRKKDPEKKVGEKKPRRSLRK